MDDSIASVENDEEGVELYRQLKALWGIASMHARKWISNSSKVVEVIPTEERANKQRPRPCDKDTRHLVEQHRGLVYRNRLSGLARFPDNEAKRPT